MSKRTYICVACRTSTRREAQYRDRIHSVRCPECQAEMWSLCWRWRIPRKNDDKGWRDLSRKVVNDAPRHEAYSLYLQKNLTDLQSKVVKAEKVKVEVKRIRKIKELKRRIKHTEAMAQRIREELKQAKQGQA